jgi:hypothetical protein
MCTRAYRGPLIRGLDEGHLLGELLGEQRLHSLGVFPVPSCATVLDLDLVRHLGTSDGKKTLENSEKVFVGVDLCSSVHNFRYKLEPTEFTKKD